MVATDHPNRIVSHRSPSHVPRSLAAPGRRHLARPALRTTLVVATILMGLIAGFFYAYACSVMIGLERADDRTFIVTMQEINASVRNVWFAPSFFGSLIVTGIAAILAGVRRERMTLLWTIGALLLYAAAFVITIGISVPLNDELAAAGSPDGIPEPGAVRDAYERSWVRWNIIRTVASTGALICLIAALLGSKGRSLSADRSP